MLGGEEVMTDYRDQRVLPRVPKFQFSVPACRQLHRGTGTQIDQYRSYKKKRFSRSQQWEDMLIRQKEENILGITQKLHRAGKKIERKQERPSWNFLSRCFVFCLFLFVFLSCLSTLHRLARSEIDWSMIGRSSCLVFILSCSVWCHMFTCGRPRKGTRRPCQGRNKTWSTGWRQRTGNRDPWSCWVYIESKESWIWMNNS